MPGQPDSYPNVKQRMESEGQHEREFSRLRTNGSIDHLHMESVQGKLDLESIV